MKACAATMTLAALSRFSPRMGRSRALRRPWCAIVTSGMIAFGMGLGVGFLVIGTVLIGWAAYGAWTSCG
jgi:hypothetical protein